MVKLIRRECMGEERYFCFSLRVLNDASAKFGGTDAIFEAIDGPEGIGNVAWLAAALMDGGHRVAVKRGLADPAPVSADDILDELGVAEINALKSIIFATIANDSEAEVSVETKENPTAEAE